MNRLFVGSPDKTNFILQSLAADLPHGLLLIDPTGDLAVAAANIVPTQKSFYLDPSDVKFPPGFNVLDGIPPDHRQKLVENLCTYLEGMFHNGWGAQSNYIFANCLRVLLATEGSTLLGVLKLLTDKSYRAECIPNCTDPVVQENWRVISGWDAKQFQAAAAPLLNKIGTLLMSPTIRNIVGQKHSTFSLTRGKIIIANLDRAKLGDLAKRFPVHMGDKVHLAPSELRLPVGSFGTYVSDNVPESVVVNVQKPELAFMSHFKQAAIRQKMRDRYGQPPQPASEPPPQPREPKAAPKEDTQTPPSEADSKPKSDPKPDADRRARPKPEPDEWG
jgi:hypothetical protein